MKDRLMYVTIGVLISVVVIQWMQPQLGNVGVAHAGFVSPTATGIVSLFVADPIDENGVRWSITEMGREVHASPVLLPVLMSDIKFFHPEVLITYDNVAWRFQHDPFGQGQWVYIGPWPNAPVSTRQSTLGNIKNMDLPRFSRRLSGYTVPEGGVDGQLTIYPPRVQG